MMSTNTVNPDTSPKQCEQTQIHIKSQFSEVFEPGVILTCMQSYQSQGVHSYTYTKMLCQDERWQAS